MEKLRKVNSSITEMIEQKNQIFRISRMQLSLRNPDLLQLSNSQSSHYGALMPPSALSNIINNIYKMSHQLRVESATKQRAPDYRRFLSVFKTIDCKIPNCSSVLTCQSYHSREDRRRNPYANNSISYNAEMCFNSECCDENCRRCHNQWELQFHPLIYLSIKCNRYNNCDVHFCPYLHYHQFNSNFSNFFRFDIITFKTRPCFNECTHNLKTCLFFHNRLDRRRPIINYEHVSCEFKQSCPKQDECQFSHNKIEQLYHPSRYKSKFCEKYPDKIHQCQYKEFCSFAHYDSEILIKLIERNTKDTEFYVNQYKTIWCPYTTKHDRNKCVYAHNVQDFRRNPKIYKYQPEVCPYWNMTENLTSLEMGGCPKAMDCKKCHGWKQLEFHPAKYKGNKDQKNPKKNYIYSNNQDNFEKQELMRRVNKKTEKNQERKPQSPKIYPVVLDQKLITHMVGAPFFQHQTTIEYKPIKIKNRGTASETDSRSKAKPRKQSVDSISSKQDSHDQNKIFTYKLFSFQEDEFFKESLKPMFECEPKKQRTRSLQKKKPEQQINYSRELRQHIGDVELLNKLQSLKINEIKLLNLNQNDLTELEIFNSKQREFLLFKIKEFNERSQVSYTSYSTQLYQLFGKTNQPHLLQKMKRRKVRQEKLLNLVSKEIENISFLEQEQKQLLPKLIQEFNNNKEFSDIVSMISKATQVSDSVETEQKP